MNPIWRRIRAKARLQRVVKIRIPEYPFKEGFGKLPAARIDFTQKPADFDELMKRFPAYVEVGNSQWIFTDSLGTTTVTALGLSSGQFFIITDCLPALHIPWERANKIAREIQNHYGETCQLKLLGVPRR